MKKFLAGLIVGLILATTSAAAAAQAITVYVDGKQIASDVPAQIISGRTMLPIRAISEALGAEVNWVPETQSVYITTVETQSKPAPAATWKEVTFFEGEEIKDTEIFYITSNEWKIKWSTEPGIYGNTNFAITVYDSKGSYVGNVANLIGAGSDESLMRGSGDYYLNINTGQPYTIVIYEKV